jgi:DNA-binding XRE family transcriptional regulator
LESLRPTKARGPRVDADAVSIREIRLRRGFTQLDLAYHSGITPQTVSRIENGWQAPNLETCNRLAAALAVPLSDIVGSVMELRPPRQIPASEKIRRKVVAS